jgi:hypothetical protein
MAMALLAVPAFLETQPSGVHADVFGLGPTLVGRGPGLVVEQRGASGPLPSQILGLEGYALWGKNAGAAAGVTYKHRFASVPVGTRKIRLRYGLLGGVSTAGTSTQPLIGGFVEAEAEGLAGLVLVIRLDDGVYVNPGLKVNLVSVSF